MHVSGQQFAAISSSQCCECGVSLLDFRLNAKLSFMRRSLKRFNFQDLAECRLFRGVDDQTFDLIVNAAKAFKLSSGQNLFEHGDDGASMYVVLEGRLEVSAVTIAGRKISLNLVGAGECIGEISMFDGSPRSATIVVQEDAILQPISKSTFISASAQSAALALNMIEILCDRFRWVSSSVEDFAILSLDRRLARRLLLLDQRFSNQEGEITITQNDLADFAGASREATNKVLMQWKATGLIDMRRGSIKLLLKDKLDRIAHESG
jgi:CRP/FNR family transcriptional regulator, cyclic AMP receptor protein